MGHKDLGLRNYNPSLKAQQTKIGKAYLVPIRKMEPYERLLYWIKERHTIHCRRFPDGVSWDDLGYELTDKEKNRAGGKPPPWTDDPILQTVFFCNVYRENDKVTAFLRDNYRSPHRDEKHVFLGTILLRWYNKIETMASMIDAGIPHSFGVARPARTPSGKSNSKGIGWSRAVYDELDLQGIMDSGTPVFGGAYIIRPVVDGVKDARKVASLGDLMTQMATTPNLYKQITGDWEEPDHEGNLPGTMAYAFNRLTAIKGMGPFYVYQFIGDLAYTHVLENAPDWFTWSHCGPGTARGLMRLKHPSGKCPELPRNFKAPRDAMEQLLELQKQVNKDLKLALPGTKYKAGGRRGTVSEFIRTGGEVRDMHYIHMRDLTNCLCEYDKYDRALYNERSIKRPYFGQGSNQKGLAFND